MALIVCDGGDVLMLQDIADGKLSTADLRTYSNAHTPVHGDTVANYTESTYPGYASKNMLGLWSAAALNGAGKGETSCAMQTWTAGAIITPEDVVGIYITDSLGNLLYAEENPAGVVSMVIAGQTYSYTPVFTLNSEV